MPDVEKYRPKEPWKGLPEKYSYPPWLQKHPFKSLEEKKPLVITREQQIDYYHGPVDYRLVSTWYVSTDKIGYFGTFEIPPGTYFFPPDLHGGDEVYRIIKGTLSQFNPATGELHEVHEGEALYIPITAWHQSFNFTQEQLIAVNVIAPNAFWPEGMPAEYPGEPKLYKSGVTIRSEEIRHTPQVTAYGLDSLGRFPISGEEARIENASMIHISRDRMLRVLHGKDHVIPIYFYVANDLLNMGEFTLIPGASSDPESHKGEEALYVLNGTLHVMLPKTEECFRVDEKEGFFCPAEIEHQYSNLNDRSVTVIFAIAPEL